MKRSTLAARAALAAGVTAVAGAAGVSAAVASTGGTSATSHTMRFVANQLQDVMSHQKDVATDKNATNGNTVGYDVTSCAVDIHTHVATCTVAVARAKGILYGRAKVNVDTGRGSGTVTGGLGGFKGATGSVTISPGPNQNSNKITINYQA
jgi:hypothetical protein